MKTSEFFKTDPPPVEFTLERAIDGNIYQIDKGRDYDCADTIMIDMLNRAAVKVGKTLQCERINKGIVFQIS